MHMADALLSPPVAVTAGVAAAALIGVAARETKKNTRENMIPLMGVTGAFIFAAQMINFTIPGTGSSGHIVGGVLLAAMLGPWAGFLTIASVIIIQCLIFADGGLMALGCNLINMGAMTALVAYPLVFRPMMRRGVTTGRIVAASILACILGLEAGALLVVAETELSGITALPWREFILFMLPIHLAIGLGEGLATAAVLLFVQKTRPDLLADAADERPVEGRPRRLVAVFALLALLLGGGLAFYASENPDGLEWSISRVTGETELPDSDVPLALSAGKVQTTTSVMPDYDNTLSGVIGSVMVLALVWGVTSLIVSSRRTKANPRHD
ncbi:MAG: energy-coupling factor ABC transporter permease [Duncaniella sp.]|nr:energy-coupling factor ABC transporter permease [Duncaniella sp.]